MPTSPAAPNDGNPDPDPVRENAIRRLREGPNPFTFSVVTAGTEESCLHYDVPNLLDSQRSDLRAIVQLYRGPNQPSQIFPILGDSGTGKTHLLTTFQAEARQQAAEEGKECLLVVADTFSAGLDPLDFFLWQIVNHLLAQKGPGARMLRVLSARLTAHLLVEALRQLAPHQQVKLIPPCGLLDWFGLRFRNRKPVQRRLDAIRQLIGGCDVPVPTDLQNHCEQAGLAPESACELIQQHLERTESRDAAGSLRKELYYRISQLALLNQREPVEDFLTGDYREGPDHVAMAGQLPKRLLTAFLELFHELKIPVVLVFDQIEDFLIAPTSERKQALRDGFVQALAALINNVQNLCLLVFAERALWNQTILGSVNQYIRDRLDRPFNCACLAPTLAVPAENQHNSVQLTMPAYTARAGWHPLTTNSWPWWNPNARKWNGSGLASMN